VVVRVSSINSNGVTFTVVPAPNISSLSPTSGAAGATIAVNGTNFGATQGSATVTFNGVGATPTAWSATQVVTTVPAGATTGNVVLRQSGVNSNGRAFTVVPAPTITSVAPTSGAPGTPVAITGTNFGSSQGASAVRFNGQVATVSSWSATAINVTVPMAATTGPVVVTVAGGPSNGVAFTVPTLTSISVSPTTASLPVGAKQALVALGTYSNSTVANVSSAATWSSAYTAIASVSSQGVATGVATGDAEIEVSFGGFTAAANLSITPSRFIYTGSLNVARRDHLAVRLLDGRVLVIGGTDPWSPMGSEIYDPATGSFTKAGNMLKPREAYTATLLPNGKVLVTGGWSRIDLSYIITAELFDPATNTFAPTGNLTIGRGYHTATALADGRVLIVGGSDTTWTLRTATDVYDPVLGTFSAGPSLATARADHAAIRLQDGRVLIAGGSDFTNPLNSAELFDPATNTITPTGNLTVAAGHFAPALLDDGRVLLASGYESPVSQLYSPATGTFSTTGTFHTPRTFASATTLSNGKVLFVGGAAEGQPAPDAELYDPTTGTMSVAGVTRKLRWASTATALLDGTVLIVGGAPIAAPIKSAELYQSGDTLPPPLWSCLSIGGKA
jgi:hypothetical protein